MKAFLLFQDKDFDLQGPLPSNAESLLRDLELNTLFNAMALDDRFIFDISKRVILSSVFDADSILYRQAILKDCLKNPAVARELYALSVEAIESRKKHFYAYGAFVKYPGSVLHAAIDLLQTFVVMLRRLRTIAERNVGEFQSEGFRALFAMLRKELGDDYFADIQKHLNELRFRGGVLISAELGKGNKGINYVLRKAEKSKKSLIERLFGKKSPVYSFQIPERDEGGARALSELRDRGINLVANALAQSTDHILDFFTMLRTELAFYLGCLNLSEQLAGMGEPTSFPLPTGSTERTYSCVDLYDVCLALNLKHKVVGNDIRADGKDLIIVTGANEGGKSTFLRSVGLAQVMMQSGMFTPAEDFHAGICRGVFTHYRRKEDATMKSGKLDEELNRMSVIVDTISSGSVVLFNESFSATNEREGSEIARQIVSALLERRIKVFFVTHFYEFSRTFYDKHMKNALFLRAERAGDGVRTFRIIESEPEETSYGQDLYQRVFDGTDGSRQHAADATSRANPAPWDGRVGSARASGVESAEATQTLVDHEK